MTFALFRLWNIRLQLHFTQGPLNWQINIFPSRLLDVSVSGCNQNNFVQMDLFFFFSLQHLEQGRFGRSPWSTVDVYSDAVQLKLLTQASENTRRNKERLSSQQPWPESSKHLTNPDVKSKLHQLPKHAYVTSLMGFCDWPRVSGLAPLPVCVQQQIQSNRFA